MRWIRALPSLAGLMIVLVGVPVALVQWAGWPLPDHWPSSAQWQAFEVHPVTTPVIVDAVACVMWLLWAGLVAAVGAESVRMLRRLSVPSVRLPAPLHTVAASLVGSTLVGLTATPATAGSGATPPAPTVAAASTPTSVDRVDVVATAPLLPAGVGVVVVNGCGYEYKVAHGDSLWTIAEHCLGDGRRWPTIWQLNEHRFWPAVSGYTRFNDPDVIFPRWTLTLPGHAQPPPGTSAVQPHDPRPGTAPTTSPSVRPTNAAPPAGPAPAGTETPVPPRGSVSAQPAPPPSSVRRPSGTNGVTVPGGWVDLPLAAAIVSVAALVWLQRRRRYDPSATAGPVVDVDLRPLPASVTRMRRTLRTTVPAVDTDVERPLAESALSPDGPLVDRQPAASDGPRRASPTDAGLGLVGSGAASAARAMLVAALSGERGEVITTTDTVAVLLPGIDVPRPARLIVVDRLADALSRAEEMIISRRRMLQDRDVDTADELGTGHLLPPVLLLTAAPDDALAARLASTARLGVPLRMTTVILGTGPTGLDTLTVAEDGGYGDDRISVLDEAATAELLAMAAEADGRTPVVAGGERATAATDIDGPVVSAMGEPGEPGDAADRPAATVTKVQLVTLGQPAVLDGSGHRISALRTHAGDLMVYLAVRRRPVPFGDIMEAFWPDAHLGPARDRLYAEVSDLRRRIRQAAGNSKIQPVLTSGQHYQLNADVVDVDIWQIDALVESAAATDGPPSVAALTRAVALDSGILAANADWDGIEPAREQARRTSIRARVRLAELVAAAQPQRARDLVNEATMIDPYNEALAQQAMRLCADAGDLAGVESHLRRLRAALVDIDAEPTEATIALADQLVGRLAAH